MDVVFEEHDLPVVVVQNLQDIDAEMLMKWYEQYKDRVYANNATTRYKLTSAYWASYIKQKTLHLLKQQRDNDLANNVSGDYDWFFVCSHTI